LFLNVFLAIKASDERTRLERDGHAAPDQRTRQPGDQ
jgi:hypothetical protein